jgi:hypothetical protein
MKIVTLIFIMSYAFGGELIPIKDKVKSVTDQGQGFRVLFHSHAGVYSLDKSNKESSSIKKYLDEAIKNKKVIEVMADSTTLEIQSLK